MTEAISCPTFSAAVLQIDPARETDRICGAVRDQVSGRLRRKGAVLGISGGIDSSVAAALSRLPEVSAVIRSRPMLR